LIREERSYATGWMRLSVIWAAEGAGFGPDPAQPLLNVTGGDV
jgi:hypothetical protein